MFNIIITLDYELPAGGYGDVRRDMIEPTRLIMNICEYHNAKLTIMVEMGELCAFEKPENASFIKHLEYDPAAEIRLQLIDTIQRGHDVQLHLHPQWVNAHWNGTCWDLDYAHYHITSFGHKAATRILGNCKYFLEALLIPYYSDYECIGFRAGHWNTQPFERYLSDLSAAGLKSDTSVFKWGYANNKVITYDYRNAYSNFYAWYTRPDDINQFASSKGILEVPIATELTRFVNMFSIKRALLARKYLRENRQIFSAFYKTQSRETKFLDFFRKLHHLLGWHPRKLDFCKLTSRQMLSMVENLMKQYKNKQNLPIPLVMIGHSKHVGTAKGLDKFLRMLRKKFGDKFQFSTYLEFIRTYEAYSNTAENLLQ